MESPGYDVVNRNLSYFDGLIYFTAHSAARKELVPKDPDYYGETFSTSYCIIKRQTGEVRRVRD